MVEIEYKKAKVKNLEELVGLRLEVLKAANKLNDSEDMGNIPENTRNYYKNALNGKDCTIILAYDKDKIAGCGGVSYYDVMPTCDNPTGKNAYIMSMYTDPDYRRKGIANHILQILMEDISEKNIVRVTLEATDMGKELYKKNGFMFMESEMCRFLK